MDNIIQSLHSAKAWEERTLFHYLINNCPREKENMKQQGSLCVLLLLCFPFRRSPHRPKNYSPK